MRIAVVQTNPSLGAVEKNIARATALLADLPQTQVDLIVLPELAFTGYNFQSPSQILPFVETRTTAPSREWAKEIARKYECSVLVGRPTQDTHRHNTASLINSTGETIHEYYKHHMFETDYKWACTPGPGFSQTTLTFDNTPTPTSIGICMDLNPKEFIAPFTSYEYANYLLNNQVSLILLPMAWLLPSEYNLEYIGESTSTLEYWIKRLTPLVMDVKRRTVVVCNRTGEEEGAVYAGTSCVLRVGRGEAVILGILGREEGVLYVDVTL